MLLVLFIFSPAERTVLNKHFCEAILKTRCLRDPHISLKLSVSLSLGQD